VSETVLIVTVNSGSTSIKLGAFECASGQGRPAGAPHEIASVRHEGTHLDPAQELRGFLNQLTDRPAAFAHRVVHGADRYTHAVRIDAAVRRGIGELAVLAPLHNSLALRWIEALTALAGPDVPQVAVFDTAFYAALPAVAAEYALPSGLGRDVGVRRYGFHGLAHEAMWRRWCELNPDMPDGGRLISLQLGGGCSVTATAGGRPRDTSMGFSPLEGLVMATRSGDIDAAVVPYLSERLGIAPQRLIESLNREAGLLGVGGRSNPAELLAQNNERGRLAVDLYCYRIRKYIGAYLTVLEGCDGIVFGGGVGEHVPEVRARALAGLRWAGIEIDPAANASARGGDQRISCDGSRVGVWTVAVAEEPIMVRETLSVLGDSRP